MNNCIRSSLVPLRRTMSSPKQLMHVICATPSPTAFLNLWHYKCSFAYNGLAGCQRCPWHGWKLEALIVQTSHGMVLCSVFHRDYAIKWKVPVQPWYCSLVLTCISSLHVLCFRTYHKENECLKCMIYWFFSPLCIKVPMIYQFYFSMDSFIFE